MVFATVSEHRGVSAGTAHEIRSDYQAGTVRQEDGDLLPVGSPDRSFVRCAVGSADSVGAEPGALRKHANRPAATCPITAASSTGRCNTSNALIRLCFPGRTDLFDCTR